MGFFKTTTTTTKTKTNNKNKKMKKKRHNFLNSFLTWPEYFSVRSYKGVENPTELIMDSDPREFYNFFFQTIQSTSFISLNDNMTQQIDQRVLLKIDEFYWFNSISHSFVYRNLVN